MRSGIRPALLLCIIILGVSCGSKRNHGDATEPAAKAGGAPLATSQAAAAPSYGPSQTVRKYLELVDKGDINGALNLRSMKEETAPGSEDSQKELASGKDDVYIEVYTLVGVIHDVGGIKSIEILKEEVDGDSAQVDAKLSYNKARDESISCKLVKEANGWKIGDVGDGSR
jgi:hypothetical protein